MMQHSVCTVCLWCLHVRFSFDHDPTLPGLDSILPHFTPSSCSTLHFTVRNAEPYQFPMPSIHPSEAG